MSTVPLVVRSGVARWPVATTELLELESMDELAGSLSLVWLLY